MARVIKTIPGAFLSASSVLMLAFVPFQDDDDVDMLEKKDIF